VNDVASELDGYVARAAAEQRDIERVRALVAESDP
jgi:hypothetical protein